MVRPRVALYVDPRSAQRTRSLMTSLIKALELQFAVLVTDSHRAAHNLPYKHDVDAKFFTHSHRPHTSFRFENYDRILRSKRAAPKLITRPWKHCKWTDESYSLLFSERCVSASRRR